MSASAETKESAGVSVRTMREADLLEADRIFHVAFGTFMKLPDPATFAADRGHVPTRWRRDPEAALVAELDGKVAGSNFATNWGSFGYFGPLTVRPDLWDRHIGYSLVGPTVDLLTKWGVREAALLTFSDSPKHIGLYQKFGFWPRFLTAVMSKPVSQTAVSYLKYSALAGEDREQALRACRHLTDSIYEGLDVTAEIRTVHDQGLGDTVLLWAGDSLDAFAICHCGEGSEGGRDNCYVKFAAVRPGPRVEIAFNRLLDASQAFAAERGLSRIDAGMNTGRSRAYRQILQRGFRTQFLGVAMHRPDSPAYNRPEVFVIDDWR